MYLFYEMIFLEQIPFVNIMHQNKEKNVCLHNDCFLLHTFDVCGR